MQPLDDQSFSARVTAVAPTTRTSSPHSPHQSSRQQRQDSPSHHHHHLLQQQSKPIKKTRRTTTKDDNVLPPWLYHSHPAYLHEFYSDYLPRTRPPTPPPKDASYLEALGMFTRPGSRGQFDLHGGVIGSEEPGDPSAKRQRGSNPRKKNKKKRASTINDGQERKGLEKLREITSRTFFSKLQPIKRLLLWPPSKHFCWSSIATTSDPSPLTSHMHSQYMQQEQQQHQQQQQQQKKEKHPKPRKQEGETKKRRFFFPSLNSKKTEQPTQQQQQPNHHHGTHYVDTILTPEPLPTTATTGMSPFSVPSPMNNNNNYNNTTLLSPHYHHHPSSSSHRLLAAGATVTAAAGVSGEAPVVVEKMGTTPSSTSGVPPLSSSTSSSNKRSQQYEYPQYQPHQPHPKSTLTSSSVRSSSPLSPASSLLPTFVTGPEHWYHLALQLESSVLLDHQLQAKSLFTRSAESGFAPAQFKLGICFELGLVHFPLDPSQSFHWYRQAALQGHADAELAVSGWYLTGHSQGLIQSDPLAYEWAHKAALRGWSKAEYTLGHYHEVGIGVTPDLAVAKQWYLKSASRGNERALLRLLVGHVGLEVDYAHLKDALLALNQTNPYLIHQLAHFHELRDYGLVPDEETAFELYAASAQADYAPAQYKLGACYEFGILGVPQDLIQAVEWYRRGADNGHVEAHLALAGFFLDGSAGTAAPQSDEEAFRYVRKAALRGVPRAEYIAGFFLEHGLGNTRHVEQAKQWYRLACAKGVESAERRLRALEREKGVYDAAPITA